MFCVCGLGFQVWGFRVVRLRVRGSRVWGFGCGGLASGFGDYTKPPTLDSKYPNPKVQASSIASEPTGWISVPAMQKQLLGILLHEGYF